MNYRVKIILHFNDGINKGTIRIKANNEVEAKENAIAKMKVIWKVLDPQIEIVSIKK